MGLDCTNKCGRVARAEETTAGAPNKPCQSSTGAVCAKEADADDAVRSRAFIINSATSSNSAVPSILNNV
ncbi:hypothetical protein OUZ56_030480 [Daphnia magna]|uniref:Uncharacterized protein n=1 Tax=Daphnia magna TaxID=35525 RepID=A0ABQ9ZRU3_9CRUS|nr:hypothetical protein OUZ56_030480 [Daphnia magna]